MRANSAEVRVRGRLDGRFGSRPSAQRWRVVLFDFLYRCSLSLDMAHRVHTSESSFSSAGRPPSTTHYGSEFSHSTEKSEYFLDNAFIVKYGCEFSSLISNPAVVLRQLG